MGDADWDRESDYARFVLRGPSYEQLLDKADEDRKRAKEMGDAAEDAERRAEWEREHEGVWEAEQEDETTYKIVKFHFKEENEVVETGLTLEEAQEYCNREDTHGDGWFCGYTRE